MGRILPLFKYKFHVFCENEEIWCIYQCYTPARGPGETLSLAAVSLHPCYSILIRSQAIARIAAVGRRAYVYCLTADYLA